jgi:hypothetical protein
VILDLRYDIGLHLKFTRHKNSGDSRSRRSVAHMTDTRVFTEAVLSQSNPAVRSNARARIVRWGDAVKFAVLSGVLCKHFD